MNSLCVRLSIFILLATLTVGVIVGLVTFQQTLEQTVKLFDYQLRQTALSLRDHGVAEKGKADVYAEEPLDIIVRIQTIDGKNVYESHPGTILPSTSTIGFSRTSAGGVRWRVYTMPTLERVIQVAHPVEVRRRLAIKAALRSLSPLLAFAPVAALLIWWLIGREFEPVKRLEKEVIHRHAKSLEPVSEQGLPSEVAPVAKALNQLLERLDRAFRAQRAFVGDAAHELRSPLTALTLQCELLEQASTEDARRASLCNLRQGIERANRLVEQLLTAARTDPDDVAVELAPVDLAEEMRRAIGECFADAQDRNIAVEFHGSERAIIAGHSGQLQIMMRNLLDNAIRYTPHGGRISASVYCDAGRVRWTVDDSGPGIPEAEHLRVLQRFYRGNPRGQVGSGLGLSIVMNIVVQHEASMTLCRSTLGGLRVDISFPATALAPPKPHIPQKKNIAAEAD